MSAPDVTSMNSVTGSVQGAAAAPWKAVGTPADLPEWTGSFLATDTPSKTLKTDDDAIIAGERIHDGVRHRVVRVRNAIDLDGDSLTESARAAYRRLIDGVELRHIFRIWNFIPGIGQRDVADQDRYMRFNAGRFEAFREHPDEELPYPPASGVGHDGDDLVLHLLEADVTVGVVDNPRQIRPERYSRTWGPLPPAFVRSAVIRGLSEDPMLVVSGTASVRGEETMHVDDLDRQLDETITNLGELMERVASTTGIATHAEGRLDTMLVYVPRAEHLDRLVDRITRELADSSTRIEFRVGELCRPELLVEIEGTRHLKGTMT